MNERIALLFLRAVILVIGFIMLQLVTACQRKSDQGANIVDAPPRDDARDSTELINNNIEPDWKETWLFPSDKVDASYQDFYYEHLHAAHETSLWRKGGQDVLHYRFTYLRSFDPTLIFHLERNLSGLYLLTTTKLTGHGGSDAGSIDFRNTTEIDQSEIVKLRSLLESAGFWRISRPDPDADSALDGARWLFEALEDDKYHVVERSSPSRELVDLGKWFMTVSRIAIQENDIY